MSRAMGSTPQKLLEERALAFAVLIEHGPVVDSKGGATAKFNDLLVQYGIVHSHFWVNKFLNEYDNFIYRETRAKRTHHIEVIGEVPSQLELLISDVQSRLSDFKVETVEPPATDEQSTVEAPVPSLKDSVAVPRKIGSTADELADAILRKVIETYTRPSDKEREKKLREAWDQRDALRLKLHTAKERVAELEDKVSRYAREFDRMRSENAQLRHNMQQSLTDTTRVVDAEVRKQLDIILRQRPASTKGKD